MSEEIKEEILDSPLVVHSKNDASYQETASEIELEETHEEEEEPTLERHRFKKDDKKSGNKGIVLLAIIVVLSAVFCALYFTGNITFRDNQKAKTTAQTTTETTTNLIDEYQQSIVVKNTYIFVDGVQVDGIEGLQRALKYVDATQVKYRIINEDAEGSFFNLEVLPMLMQMGFYDDSTQIEHKNLTGLIAKEEITEATSGESTSVKKAKTKPSEIQK